MHTALTHPTSGFWVVGHWVWHVWQMQFFSAHQYAWVKDKHNSAKTNNQIR